MATDSYDVPGARGTVVRPLRPEDVEDAQRMVDAAFTDVDLRMTPRSLTPPAGHAPAGAARWIARTRHFLATDPGGCWVAEDDEGLAGLATSYNRELMWILATYAVRPGSQGRGIGKPLLAAALHHGRGSLRGLVASSADPRAARVYRQAGFHLHPSMVLRGTVDRAALPVVEKVREGSAGDVDLMDSIDRRARGAAHGPDHALALATWRLVVSDTSTGSGYAYLDEDGRVQLLAATNRRTATRLLWETLAATSGPTAIGHVTAANEWALDVGLAARLDVYTDGYLALRHLGPPTPYLPHGSLL